jgi:hypothetical protein
MKHENSSLLMKALYTTEEEGRKTDKNSSLRGLEFKPRNLG